MKTSIPGIMFAIAIFFLFQIMTPFPYGLVFGVTLAGIVVFYTIKHDLRSKDSLLNYRRMDPINEEERKQNDEALRILEKKYIEEKISKEEYMKRKKEFEEIEYSPKKCKTCGSENFEFVSEKQNESIEMPEGYYKCRKCGQHEK